MTAKAAATRFSFICASALLAACGRYEDFVLGAPSGNSARVSWQWRPDPSPILSPAAGEEDILNPTFANGRLFYSVFDGKTWYTAVEGKRVLAPQGWEGSYIAANGSVIFHGGEYLHWYHAAGPDTPRIGFARSRDGLTWTKHPTAVLDLGPYLSWDERGVADPYVIRNGDQFYMFYLGQDRSRLQRLGVARSADGIRWLKLRENPILDVGAVGAFDENGLGEPAVWQSNGSWWMLYTGRARNEVRRMGLARSGDGGHWDKVGEFVIAGDQPWNSKVVCDPHVEPQADGSVKVWFGGGDIAHPAERIHGKIGTGTLIPVAK